MLPIRAFLTAIRRPTARRTILWGSISAVLSVSFARGASQIWSGDGADGGWATIANWISLAAPGSTTGTTNTDVATFNAPIANTWGNSAGNPIVIDSGRNIGGINFDTATDNYFIGSTSGNALNLTSGGTIQILSTLTATNAVETINAPLIIQGASYTLANNSANGTGAGAGALKIGGGITGGAAGAATLTLSGSNTNANTISASIATGSASSLGIIKNGTGTWILAASNSYFGGTSINAGTVVVQNGAALGSGSVSVASGAALDLQNGITVGNALTISGSGSAAGQNGALSSSTSGTNTFSGRISLGTDATISSDIGTLELSNGTAIAGNGHTLTLTGAGNGINVSGFSSTGGSLIKNGSGSWFLDAASSYGSTIVNAGTLTMQASSTSTAVIVNGGTMFTSVIGSFTSTPSLTLGGGNFTYQGFNTSAGFTETMGNLTLTPGTVSGITVNNANDSAHPGTVLAFGSTFTRGADSILNITFGASQGSGAEVTASSVPGGTGAPTGTNQIFGYILVTDTSGVTGLGQLNGSNQIVRFNSQTGATTLMGSSNSAATDFTTFNSGYTGGLLDWSNGSTLGARSVNSLTIDTTSNGGSILLGGDPGSTAAGGAAVLTLTSGAVVFQGGKNETIYGGQIGATGSEVDIHQLGTAMLTVSSVLTGGAGSVVKDGSGTLVVTGSSSQTGTISGATVSSLSAGTSGLYVGEAVSGTGIPTGDYIASIGSGNITLTNAASAGPTTLTFGTPNSYTGGTYIDGGTVQAGSANALSPNSSVIMANVAGATLNLSGFNAQIGSLTGGGAQGGNVTLGSAILTVGGDNTSPAAYAGIISGTTGSLNKIGTGTLTLSGVNTYTGPTTVSQGTLLVNGSISGSLTTVSNGSTLGGTGTVGGVSAGSGAILEGGNGSSPSGALTSAGNVSLAFGSHIELILGTGGTHSSIVRTGGTWSFASNQTFDFPVTFGITPMTYDDIITGLTGSEAGLANISSWTIDTPGVVGTFSYDDDGDVDLTLTAVPEPSTAALLLVAVPMLRMRRRRKMVS